jgi:hypothetical protein
MNGPRPTSIERTLEPASPMGSFSHMNIARFSAAALAAAIFTVTAAGSARAITPASHTVAAPLAAAPAFTMADTHSADAQYCRSTGGAVERRIPEFNTNGGTPTILAGSADFCVYTSSRGKYRSSIHLLLSTLNATQPTLAALAYYARIPAGSCSGSPGSCYCSLLGGTDEFGGINLNGGAWVGRKNDVDPQLDACIFPDLSSIDSFGLFYLTNKPQPIYRGINLAKVLKFKNPFKH